MVTPKKIAIFVGTVLFVLFCISLAFPNSEIKVSENATLKFPSVQDIFNPQKVEYADISDLIKESEMLEQEQEEIPTPEKTDSNIFAQAEIKKSVPQRKIDTVRADARALLKHARRIEYPGNDTSLLHPFFKDLERVDRLKGPVRILHYGDSQIEGDRITSFVRDRLQRRFGGNGAGLLPVVQPYGQFSMKQDVSSNWRRYTIFGKRDTTLFHKRYGALASFCRFSPHESKKGQTTYEAWMKLEKGIMGYDNVRDFNRFKIFYGYNKKPFMAEVYAGREMVDADFIPVANGIKVLSWYFDSTPKDITVKFKGDDSPDIYALSFESNKGVLMDNIAMRGSAGLEFTKMDKQLLKKMYEELSVKLIVLQFGVNVVPYIKGDCSFYGKSFYNQLLRIKSVAPGIPILVIGPADMSVKEKDYFVTYPALPKVRDVLKEATFKAGCAYWDMYEAMGGENSMPSWVFADPPLASTDFVHFNHRGARLIAEMFYNALMYEFGVFSAGKRPENMAYKE